MLENYTSKKTEKEIQAVGGWKKEKEELINQ